MLKTKSSRTRLYLELVQASLKMYFRDRQALFWSLAFPVVFMVIFGYLNFGVFVAPVVGVVNHSDSVVAQRIVTELGQHSTIELRVLPAGTDLAQALMEKSSGLDVAVEIPADFAAPPAVSAIKLFHQNPQSSAVAIATSTLDGVLDEMFQATVEIPDRYLLASYWKISPQLVEGASDVSYRVFLTPGIIAMTIMQIGIFGVVFTLVRYKAQGVLRRLRATPAGATPFLFGQNIVRLVVVTLSTVVLLAVGVVLFEDLRSLIFGYSVLFWMSLLLLVLLGGATFISIGLAISGRFRSENAAAPVANLISLPMLFLSGVFFATDVLPTWLQPIVQYLPLSFLVNGLRETIVNGASLVAIGGELLGLLAWTVVTFVSAVLLFRWE